MKRIAIRGDKENGHKIIQYFRSLGAINKFDYSGEVDSYYFIGEFSYYNIIDARTIIPGGYEVFESWNEFEKNYLNKNKMEERNIKISLEKAKEWYKQGGDLREVALQAFTEDELIDKYPTTWQDYIFKVNSAELIDADDINGFVDYSYFKTKEEAEAFIALGCLIQLRDEYWRLDNNWNSDLAKCNEINPTIMYVKNLGRVMRVNTTGHYLLMFRTDELREKFYENFKDLIEQAKMFL